MPTRETTLAQPLRSRSEAPGSIYSPIPRPAQPSGQPTPERNEPMSRKISRLYGLFTTIAICGLISPLLAASLTFAGPSA